MTQRPWTVFLAACLLCGSVAQAQNAAAKDPWRALAAKASGTRLDLGVQPYGPNIALARAFAAKFPAVDVRITQMAVTNFSPRVLAEQKAGIYAWDAYFGQVLNAANVLVPAGGVAKITEYLVLPEVRDSAAWRSETFLYQPDGERYIFNFSISFNSAVFINTGVLKGFRPRTANDLLDPRLKGRIAIRMADRSGAGAVTLAAFYSSNGPDFVRRLLTQTNAVFYENPRQITTAVIRGEKAVAIGGGSSDILGACQFNGGCRDIETSSMGNVILPRGVFVLKNAPHKDATKLWINWLLSREGQQIYVREWAKSNQTGAVSMRRDVKPMPGHEASLPDFEHPGKQLFLGTKGAERIVAQAVAIFRDVRAHTR